ncbi:hypothetical protein [Burkholderia cenocepacia]|uniref:hypothetical protein n=1 Tax=Burkholderia cenocepacia TaxID=95486 RepID=UPI0022380B24|nr:hypothetical protein [Burkholderia cenocepacia]MCW5156321.1 hypothetical protein [Burkholderia cenocepacia]
MKKSNNKEEIDVFDDEEEITVFSSEKERDDYLKGIYVADSSENTPTDLPNIPEIERRVNHNLATIVPPEHVLIVKDELLWGNLSPFKRNMGEEVEFYQGWAHYFTRNGFGARMLITNITKGGYAYKSIGEPYTQSKDSFYFTCLLDPKVDELLEYMKKNMAAPTPEQHYDILLTHAVARTMHLNNADEPRIEGIEQDPPIEYNKDIPNGKLIAISEHHQRLVIKAMIDYNMTEESIKLSQGRRSDIDGLEDYLPVLRKNSMNTQVQEKPTKAQMLSDEIENEGFSYKPSTTKTNRTKL